MIPAELPSFRGINVDEVLTAVTGLKVETTFYTPPAVSRNSADQTVALATTPPPK